MNKKLVALGLVAVVATLIYAMFGFPYFTTVAPAELVRGTGGLFQFPHMVGGMLREAGLPALGMDSIPSMRSVRTLSLYEGLMNGLALIALPTVSMAGFLLIPVPGILLTITAFKTGHYFTAALGVIMIPLVVLVAPISLVFYTLAAGYLTLTMPSHDAQYLLTLVPMLLFATGASVGVVALGWQALITVWGWATIPFLWILSGSGGTGGGGDRGTVIKSYERRGLFGNRYIEHRNENEEKVAETHEKSDLFGNRYLETTDESGRKAAESRERRGLLGDKYTETTREKP